MNTYSINIDNSIGRSVYYLNETEGTKVLDFATFIFLKLCWRCTKYETCAIFLKRHTEKYKCTQL